MNIFGIGIDIVELKRINRLYSLYGERFAKKILNDEELLRFFKLLVCWFSRDCLSFSQVVICLFCSAISAGFIEFFRFFLIQFF